MLYWSAISILAVVFLFATFMIGRHFYDEKKSAGQFETLTDLIEETPEEQTPEVQEPTAAEKYASVLAQNEDFVGWIKIEGTRVDYPVVQRPESVDYYLRRDYYGNYDSHGCIYVREVCDVNKPSDNLTIYGHRMKDNTMFADLAKMTAKSYWQDHQYIYFDTLTEYHTYQIICVFITTASVGEGFTYHQFVEAANEEDFNRFLYNCNMNRVFDTGLTASYGDKLITLSTCEYTNENGRLVVVAKRID